MKEEKTVGQITVEKNVGGIEGLCVITPAVHGDARGYFMETYNEREMKEAGFDIQFVQDNQSMSVKGVLRGLHFQINYPQCKLVRAVRGSVFDVAVDLREKYRLSLPGHPPLRRPRRWQSVRPEKNRIAGIFFTTTYDGYRSLAIFHNY